MALRPTTTQAAILVAQHEPLVVDTIELPSNLDVGQVLVELQCSGICGSQLGEIDGVKGPDRYLPHLMGHEGFARVLRLAPGSVTSKSATAWCCTGVQVQESRVSPPAIVGGTRL